MPTIRFEIRRLLTLAVPVVVTQLASMFLGVVDTLMVGHVSVQTLAAAAIGHVWTFGTTIFAMGLVLGIDPIVTQAYGAGDAVRQGRAMQRGIIVGLVISIPVAILWLFADKFLLFFGQAPELAAMARDYSAVQVFGIPFFMVYTAIRQYLQGRGVVKPAMYVAILANLVNVAANWALIFGHLGMPAMGITGAGIATACTRVFMCVLMVWITLRGHLTEDGWVPWSREAFEWSGLREVLHYGWPVGLQFSLEVWAFQAATLMAGKLDEASLAAHSIVLNVASVSFMVPLGIGFAAVTRVGNLIGAGDRQAAQRASWVAIFIGAGVMGFSAVLFLLLRHQIPRLYTDDPAVLALAASVFPIAAAFQLFDGTQVVGCGILRGMGSTKPAAVFNLIGYYILALPLAWWMAFDLDMGIDGLWWGLAIGLAAVAVMVVVWVKWRGPGRTEPAGG